MCGWHIKLTQLIFQIRVETTTEVSRFGIKHQEKLEDHINLEDTRLVDQDHAGEG